MRPKLVNDRHHAHDDDPQRYEREVILDDLPITEPITCYEECHDPDGSAKHVVEPELGKMHLADPATKGANVLTMGTNLAKTMALAPYFS